MLPVVKSNTITSDHVERQSPVDLWKVDIGLRSVPRASNVLG